MKKINLALAFALFCFSVTAQNIDVRNVTLNLNFDWLKKQANGTATITFSTTKETDKIFLDAGFLSIESILLGDKNLSFQYDRKDTAKNLAITLNRKYNPTELIAIQIAYHTNYINDADPNSIGGSFGKGLLFFNPPLQHQINKNKSGVVANQKVINIGFLVTKILQTYIQLKFLLQ